MIDEIIWIYVIIQAKIFTSILPTWQPFSIEEVVA